MCPRSGDMGSSRRLGRHSPKFPPNRQPFRGRSVSRHLASSAPEDGKSQRQFFTLAEGENHMAHELLFCETEGAYTAPAFHADTVID